jgi:hypothetical protein
MTPSVAMEISIEYDPNFGEGSEDDLVTPAWQKLALDNTNDDPGLRGRRMHRLKELLDEDRVVLCPGDERQLLGLLRAAKCNPEKAVESAKAFLDFQSYLVDGMETTFTIYGGMHAFGLNRKRGGGLM